MTTPDYAALAKQYGGTSAPAAGAPVDYAALAAQYGGKPAEAAASEWEDTSPTKVPESKLLKETPTATSSDDDWEDYAKDEMKKTPQGRKLLAAQQAALAKGNERMSELGVDPVKADAALKAVEKEPWYKQALGAGEATVDQAIGMGAAAVGGVAGAARTGYNLAAGEGLDESTRLGEATIRGVESAAPQPHTATGQAINEATNYASAAPGKVVGYGAKETVKALGGSEKAQLAAESIGEAAPAMALTAWAGGKALKDAPKAPVDSTGNPINTRGASMLRKALEADKAAGHLTAENLAAAQAEIDFAKAKGISLVGTEPLENVPNLKRLTERVDRANPIIRSYIKNRPEEAKAVLQEEINKLGTSEDAQSTANAAQETATTTLRNAEKDRTSAVNPHYNEALEGDKEALQLMDDITAKTKDISAGTEWKNAAVQQAGLWYKFTHDIGLKANEVASKMKEWVGTDAEKKALADMEAEGGKPNPKTAQVNDLIERHKEGQAATQEAVAAAAERQAYLDKWQAEVNQKADKLAEHKLPEIQANVAKFTADIDEQLRLHTADHTPNGKPVTREGEILKSFRDQIAGLTLPSQLESVRKTISAALNVGISSTAEERQMAKVLHEPVENLTKLIDSSSSHIAQGRALYKQLSETIVDPLKKSTLGYLAGKGADAAIEAPIARMYSVLQSDRASPTSIAKLADNLNKTDKTTFPNMVQELLRKRLDEKTSASKGSASTPADFVKAIADTDKERANLEVMIKKTAEAHGLDPKTANQAARGFNTLLQVMRSTGRIKDLGRQALEESGIGKTARLASGGVHTHAMSSTTAAFEAIGNRFNKAAYKNMAEVLTSPDAINKMVQLANLKATSQAARRAMAADIMLMGVSTKLDEDDKPLHVDISGLPK